MQIKRLKTCCLRLVSSYLPQITLQPFFYFAQQPFFYFVRMQSQQAQWPSVSEPKRKVSGSRATVSHNNKGELSILLSELAVRFFFSVVVCVVWCLVCLSELWCSVPMISGDMVCRTCHGAVAFVLHYRHASINTILYVVYYKYYKYI